MPTWIYHMPTPEGFDSESFSELFSWLEIEGIEELEDSIKVYISEDYQEEFEAYLEEISAEHTITFTKDILEEKNWNEDWEKNFQPVKINQLAGIRASFHEPFDDVQYDIIINPKMSFGTGHHATTRQVMELMDRMDIAGKKVLDCGSGTGILAILAAKMEASPITAVDNDPWCFENHQENNELNNVSMNVILGGIEDIHEFDFDVILANIQRNWLLENMHHLAARLKKGGELIISGFWPVDNKDLLDKALENDLIAQYNTDSENWSCILLKKKDI